MIQVFTVVQSAYMTAVDGHMVTTNGGNLGFANALNYIEGNGLQVFSVTKEELGTYRVTARSKE